MSHHRGYGARTAGYSIGLARFRLPSVHDNSPDSDHVLFLVKCVYDEDDFGTRARHELTDVAKGFERF